jgi:MoxR-like ATPase
MAKKILILSANPINTARLRLDIDTIEVDEAVPPYLRSTLGPLGTAFLPAKTQKPRILLIDEIDKSDIDLPNDLLNIFEEGRFEIPELVRIKKEVATVEVRTAYNDQTEETTKEDISTEITEGLVICNEFPFHSD